MMGYGSSEETSAREGESGSCVKGQHPQGKGLEEGIAHQIILVLSIISEH